jgi:hypothetical protein|tara:strand:+ start:970 stop:1197 length:228 start_codon:yes stop_codon:yes gene_type:complete
MKTSKNPSVRIKRAVKQLQDESNSFNIGNVIFEDIILKGIEQMELAISKQDRSKNHIIPISMFEDTIQIIKEHIK